MMCPLEIIQKYYPDESETYKILLKHSLCVAEKAIQIGNTHPELQLDIQFIEEAAMLHDIGIFLCYAPEIGCYGKAAYICHGYLGADILRKEGYPNHAFVCERHTGAGISFEMIERFNLPLPRRELRPQSLEEKLICYADKFFSKTNLHREKTIEQILTSMAKYGEESLKQFKQWHQLFGLKDS